MRGALVAEGVLNASPARTPSPIWRWSCANAREARVAGSRRGVAQGARWLELSAVAAAEGSGVQPAPEAARLDRGVVKVCGVVHPDDASLAAAHGADLVGMILHRKARRAVEGELARAIAEAARAGGAEPVGVFVDESADEISAAAKAVGLSLVQLHGPGARDALAALPQDLGVVYVLNVSAAGRPLTPLPPAHLRHRVSLYLLDSPQAGTGHSWDWGAAGRIAAELWGASEEGEAGDEVDGGEARAGSNPVAPRGFPRGGWLLAGGLKASNVATAVETASPLGVDTSSGVAGPDGLRKDPAQVSGFVSRARAALLALES